MGVAAARRARGDDRAAGALPYNVFIARQPIFDPAKNVYGYELLFRSGVENLFNKADLNRASAKVMTDGAFLFSPSAISCGRLSFINVTRDILVNDYIRILPRSSTAVEIPEALAADPDVVLACARLKEAGYLLVLDDFRDRESSAPLLEMADIVKLDFLATSPPKRQEILSRLRGADVCILAEKVEVHEHFKQAVDLGCSYLQGYFFSKPEIISARDVPGYKINYLQMLREIQSPGMDVRRMEAIVKRDAALAFKLLRYINSAYFGLVNNVISILHAIMLLGPREFKQWASLLLMAGMGSDKPDELVVEGLVRARFCESLAARFQMRQKAEQLFLLGMFSLMDAILGRPMEEILKDLPILDDSKKALLGEAGPLRTVLDYAIAYERGDWDKVWEIADTAGLDESVIPLIYQTAVQWAEQSFEEVLAADREDPRASGLQQDAAVFVAEASLSTAFQKSVKASEMLYGAGGLEGRGRPSNGGAAHCRALRRDSRGRELAQRRSCDERVLAAPFRKERILARPVGQRILARPCGRHRFASLVGLAKRCT